MDLNGVPPPSMEWNAFNLPEAWRQFQEHTDLIFQGPLKEKGEDIKVTYLLLWVGKKGRDIFKTLPIPEGDRKKLKEIYKAFKSHVQPKLNPVFCRFKFNNEVQGDNTMEQFVTNVRLLARDCRFPNEPEMIRDRIVFGVKSQKVREKLINEGEKLTMDKAIEICQNFEYAQEQLKSMSEPSTAAVSVHAVQNPPTVKDQSGRRTTLEGCQQPGQTTNPEGSRPEAEGRTSIPE